MNSDFTPSREFERLLVAVVEGHMDQDRRSRLNELVGSSRDIRDYYVHYLATHSMLHWSHGKVPELKVAIDDEPDDVAGGRDVLSWTVSLTVAASLLIALAWSVWRVVIHEEPIATVIGTTNVVGSGLREGDSIQPGKYEFESGTIQIELKAGVVIAMQGPIEMTLRDDNRVRLVRGTVRAYVAPKARGFTIETPKVHIVDLGTEFGVQVDEHDHVEVHVFKGKVRLNQLELRAGEAVHVHMQPSKDTRKNQFKVHDVKLNGKIFPSI